MTEFDDKLLTENIIPWCFLSTEIKNKFLEGAKTRKVYFCLTEDYFESIDKPSWAGITVYRLDPIPPTKPSIDWSHVAKKFNWLARDINGMCYLYEQKPYLTLRNHSWGANKGRIADAIGFASLIPGDWDGENSLVERPHAHV